MIHNLLHVCCGLIVTDFWSAYSAEHASSNSATGHPCLGLRGITSAALDKSRDGTVHTHRISVHFHLSFLEERLPRDFILRLVTALGLTYYSPELYWLYIKFSDKILVSFPDLKSLITLRYARIFILTTIVLFIYRYSVCFLLTNISLSVRFLNCSFSSSWMN